LLSLRRRLLISATLLLLVFLGLTSVGLNRAFESSVISNAEDALRNQILLLIANVDVVDDELFVPELLSEPRLSQMDSTLYAQIYHPDETVLWRSQSLLNEPLPKLAGRPGEFDFFAEVSWPEKPKIYAMTLGVEWETDQGDFPFTVQVAETTTTYVKRLRRYKRQVGLWLAVLGVSLMTLLLLLLGWALKPLNKVTKQVAEIEQGARSRFDEDYPQEVSRLTQNLNQLLNSEEKRITRHKEVLGNLAHSLKTPIAVLKGLKYDQQTHADANEQLSSMQNIIDYQLQSASAVGRQRFAKPIEIKTTTEQIVSSLDKLHKEKQLNCTLNIADDVRFFGDQGDWMELVGNLLDNAFKWAQGKVEIEVSNQAMKLNASHRLATVIRVTDDGPGIDETLKATILQRGVRLDSQTPGHGLGLHIVKGIVEAYEGDIAISDVQPQGTRFDVVLN